MAESLVVTRCNAHLREQLSQVGPGTPFDTCQSSTMGSIMARLTDAAELLVAGRGVDCLLERRESVTASPTHQYTRQTQERSVLIRPN